jgi:glycerol-3-phosphate acyltransferase PlsY
MPPSAYLGAARDLLSLDFSGLARVAGQLAHWLAGPAESYWTIPVNAVGVAILIYVVVRGHSFDPWLRLIGASALAQHAVALFYNAAIARYHFLTWFLTMLVVMVWFHQVGIDWLARRYPALSARMAGHPLAQWLASALTRLQKSAA